MKSFSGVVCASGVVPELVSRFCCKSPYLSPTSFLSFWLGHPAALLQVRLCTQPRHALGQASIPSWHQHLLPPSVLSRLSVESRKFSPIIGTCGETLEAMRSSVEGMQVLKRVFRALTCISALCWQDYFCAGEAFGE